MQVALPCIVPLESLMFLMLRLFPYYCTVETDKLAFVF